MIIKDKEFGEVVVRKNPLVKGVKFSISTSGRLLMTIPKYTSNFFIKKYLNFYRDSIRNSLPLKNPDEQKARDYQKKILSKKAKEYLPYRLAYFAKLYNYNYNRCRLSHASTRWGSCSSNGTISLNIGLMKVPEELRDYVIIHELAHLNHMDHSREFWAEVGIHDKNYKINKKRLKMFSPGL